METIGPDMTMLEGNKRTSSLTESKELMHGTNTCIVAAQYKPIDIDDDTMLVEEIENSTSFTQIMDGTKAYIDIVDAQKEPTDIGNDLIFVEETEQSKEVADNIVEVQKETTTVSYKVQHNKPKRANTKVIPADYVCTAGDIATIESIMSAPEKTKFVDIGDAELSNNDLMLNAYIYCMSACDHLLDRADGDVYLDNTFVSAVLKQDKSQHHRVIKQLHLYLKHDMVFLPINISKTHWYLAVINAKKRLIQVLDSLGPGMSRNDLNLVLQGLEKHLKFASNLKNFDKGKKWQDLNVTTWPIVEHFQEPAQTDGVSCGLFMLNYMEYWTGDVLSDHVNQEDMKEFRRKLVVILIESELNKIKGKPIYYHHSDEKNVSDSDCMIVEGPKRQDLPDVANNKHPVPVHITSTNPRKLVDELCKHILSIKDDKHLEQEWVRSSKPYPIGLSLKKIQDILRMDKPMDNECFNLAIRIVACDEIIQMVETDVHYMDLRFCTAMVDSTRGHKWRKKPNIQSLATLLESWPGTDYKISSRKLILLPYASAGHFTLFSIDKHVSSVSVFDPLSVLPSPESKMRRAHNMQLKLQRTGIYLSEALGLAQPDWDGDIFSWPRRSPVGIPESPDKNASGYFIFYIILSWNGRELVHPICTNVFELRKKFLVHLLKYHENEAEENISNIARQYLQRAGGVLSKALWRDLQLNRNA